MALAAPEISWSYGKAIQADASMASANGKGAEHLIYPNRDILNLGNYLHSLKPIVGFLHVICTDVK